MDIRAYIESGKLELFLLGELSDREREEVLELAGKYPEIQKELDELEAAIIEFDQASAPVPSSDLKNKIFEDLEGTFESSRKSEQPESQAAIKSLFPWKPFAVAASIVAVLALGSAFYFAGKFYDKEEELISLLQEQEVMANSLNQVKQENEVATSRLDRLVAGDFNRVEMLGKSLPMQKDAKVDVFWDKNAQEVFVAVNNLNELSDEFDYQLWAIGDDGPVGIGLVNPNQKFTLQQMDAVAQAGAFAITIEPKGGVDSPNLEKLVVLGEVA